MSNISSRLPLHTSPTPRYTTLLHYSHIPKTNKKLLTRLVYDAQMYAPTASCFVNISYPSMHDRDIKLPFFFFLLLLLFFFCCCFFILNLDAVLSDSTPENFANIWQIKGNWICSMKFDKVQIHFLSDVFGLLSSRNFATLATWHNDFSYLLNTSHENDFPEKWFLPAENARLHWE